MRKGAVLGRRAATRALLLGTACRRHERLNAVRYAGPWGRAPSTTDRAGPEEDESVHRPPRRGRALRSPRARARLETLAPDRRAGPESVIMVEGENKE